MPATVKATNIQEPSSSVTNLSLSTSGGVTVGQNLSVAGTSTVTGQLLTGNLYLTPNAGVSPQMQFQSGTLLSTPVAGAMEYDGSLFYSTFQNNRGLIDGSYVYVLNSSYTLPSPAGTSNWLNGLGVTIDTNICYLFEGTIALVRTGGALTNTIALNFGGTFGYNLVAYTYIRYYSATGFAVANTTPQGMGYIETPSSTAIMAGNTSGTQYHVITLKGIVNNGTSGTFIPQISGFASGSTVVIQLGSYFKMTPIAPGNNLFNSYVGTWA
jgi:hypothetical protein